MHELSTRGEAEVDARGEGEIRLADLRTRNQRLRRTATGAGMSSCTAGSVSDPLRSTEAAVTLSGCRILVIEDCRDFDGFDGEQVVRSLRQFAQHVQIRVRDRVLVGSLRRNSVIELDRHTSDEDWRALQVAIDAVQGVQRAARDSRAARASLGRRQLVSHSRHTNLNLPHWVKHAQGGATSTPYPIGGALRVQETLRMWSIFRWYLDGESPESIAGNRLADQSSPHSEQWTAQSVSRYLSSRSVVSRAPLGGALGDQRQPYPALFSTRTFALVQDLTAARQALGRAASANLLSGRAFCGQCAQDDRESKLHYREIDGKATLRCEDTGCRATAPYAKVEKRVLRWLSGKLDFATELANPLAVDESVLHQAVNTFDWRPAPQDQPDPPSLEEHLRRTHPVARVELADEQAALTALEQLARSDAGRLKLRVLILRRLDRVTIRHDEDEPREREYVAAFSTYIDLLRDERPRRRSRAVLHMDFVDVDEAVGGDLSKG